MLVIRLRRIGKRKDPSYRVVVAEAKFAPSGKFVADLGFYNPKTKNISLDKEQVLHWLNKGAKPSNTIAKLLKREKVSHSSIVIKTRHRTPKAKQGQETTSTQPTLKTEETREPAELSQSEAAQQNKTSEATEGTPEVSGNS